MQSTPPLAWLRAFEAAARLLSFKDAATELSVSPSTISHQIRDLESALATPLFSRLGKGIQLTQEGRELLVPLKQGFELLRQATSKRPDPAQFSIGAFAFLGSEVLLPATQELKQLLEVDQLVFQTNTELSSLLQIESSGRTDVVIKYGPMPSKNEKVFPGYVAIPLFQIRLAPIYATTQSVPKNLDALMQLPYVRLTGPFDAWRSWSSALNLEVAERVPVFETDNYHAAALAVERGEGCCLGVFPFLSRWLTEGRIQVLSQFSCEIPQYAYLVFAHHNQSRPAMARLADWLQHKLA